MLLDSSRFLSADALHWYVTCRLFSFEVPVTNICCQVYKVFIQFQGYLTAILATILLIKSGVKIIIE